MLKKRIKKFLKIEYLFIVLYLFSLIIVLKQMSGEFVIPSLIRIGTLQISIYGILMVVAIIIGSIIAVSIKPKDLDEIDVFTAILWVILPAFVFARLWHIATDFNLYENHIVNVFSVNHGGLSIFGGLAGGSLGLILFSWLHGFSVRLVTNLVVVIVPFGQAIGRFGNLVNQELFGPPTNSFLKMYVSPENRPLDYLNFKYFHPAFFYESILCFILFIFLLLLWHILITKKKFILENTYFLVGLYLVAYGLIRFVVEFYRLEENFFLGLSFNQLVSILFIFIGLVYITKLFLSKRLSNEN